MREIREGKVKNRVDCAGENCKCHRVQRRGRGKENFSGGPAECGLGKKSPGRGGGDPTGRGGSRRSLWKSK